MGIENKNMVPVKYKGGEDANESRNMNIMMACLFGGALFMLYRTIHGKGGTGSKSDKSGKSGGGGPFGGGGGGMGDLMNMNKSGA